jgi:hypothetical protein
MDDEKGAEELSVRNLGKTVTRGRQSKRSWEFVGQPERSANLKE